MDRVINPRTIHKKIYYDDTDKNYDEHDITEYEDNYVKLIVVNKKDLYQFDKFTERLLKADCHEVKIIEDFSTWMLTLFQMILLRIHKTQ